MKYNNANFAPGVFLAATIAFISEYLHNIIIIGNQKPISGVIIAIVLGIAYKNLIGVKKTFEAGISLCLKKVLKIAIILLGLSLSFSAVITTGAKSFVIILLCVTVSIMITYKIGQKLGLSSKLAALIGIGTSICGATAIVAAAPAIEAGDEEVAFSVATITIFGVMAIFLYPILGKLMLMTDIQFGTWAGVAVHETAQVVAAGFAYSDAAGKVATIVKLTRTVLLAPLVLLLGVIYARQNQKANREKVNILSIFPWFVVGFMTMAALRTIGDAYFTPSELWVRILTQSKEVSKYFILVAMAGVGLMTNIKQMKTIGLKPFITGMIASLIMAVFSLSMIYALGI